MCQAIKEYYDETGIQIGFKPAGGLNSVMDALIYYTIVKEVLGEKWLSTDILHDRQRGSGRKMAHKPVVPYGYLPISKYVAQRGHWRRN